MKLTILIALVFFPLFSFSQAVYIDSESPDGGDGTISNPFNEISDVTNWAANTTYYLKRGSDFYITSPIVFNQHNTTLDAYGNGTKPRIWTDVATQMWIANDNNGVYCINPQVRNVKFECTLPVACYNETPNLVNFNKCIDGMAYHVDTYGGGRGICAASSKGTLTFRGCHISHTDDDGTWLYKTRHVVIDSCHYEYINRGYTLTCQTRTGGDCVQLAGGAFGENATSLTITNSILDRRAYDYKFNIMVGSYSSNPIDWPSLFVSNTQLLHAGNDGSNIYTNEVDSVVLDRVTLSGNTNGIYKGYNFGTNYVITRCIFENHSNYHIWSQVGDSYYDNASMVLRNNVFDGASNAFAFFSYRDNVDMQNCVITNTTNNVFYSGIGSSSTDYNCYYNNGGNYKTDEAHGIYSDPLFVGNGDYSLQSNSPLIDAGNAQTIGLIDINGTLIPQGSGWDIGAIEYIDSSNNNQPPVANAGQDQTVSQGQLIVLDGTDSEDDDGDSISFQWTAPQGITLSSDTSATPSFTAPDVTDTTQYTFSLVVNDGLLNSNSDEITITVLPNLIPIANAGPDQTAAIGDTVIFNGGSSYDPEGNDLSFQWTAPVGITLSSDSIAYTFFIAPTVTDTTQYTFSLVVNDGEQVSEADEVIITVIPLPNINEAELLTIGNIIASDDDGNVPANINDGDFTTRWSAEGEQWIQMSLEDSSTINYIKVAWLSGDTRISYFDIKYSVDSVNWIMLLDDVQTSGTTLDLETYDVTDVEAKFIRFECFGNSVSDWNSITEVEVYGNTEIPNFAPLADAGFDQTVLEGDTVILNGSNSYDPEGEDLSYQWTVPASISLSSDSSAYPNFIAPDVTDTTQYTFSLVVNDGEQVSEADEVIITVIPLPNTNEAELLTIGDIIASDDDGNVPANINDGDLTTRWSAEGEQWIQMSLEDSSTINYIKVAWLSGDTRISYFDIKYSVDSTNWIMLLDDVQTSGTTLDFETYDVTDVQAKYIRFDCFGNSVSDWNSITEVEVYGNTETQNLAPLADAGLDQTVVEGDTVILNGSNSYDPENDDISFQWSAPVGITLSSDSSASPTFIAAVVSDTIQYTFSLVVNDGQNISVEDQVVITVIPTLEPGLLTIGDIIASDDDGNVPANINDGNLNTRWSAEGEQWIQMSLENTSTISYIKIAWLSGDSRVSYFDIKYSMDSVNWIMLLDDVQTSGTTLDFETYDFSDVEANYIRFDCYGNSVSDWNSITEVEIYGFVSPEQKSANIAADGNELTSSNNQNSNRFLLTNEKIKIYPNPISDFLTIEIGSNILNQNITIFDLNGKVMYQKRANSTINKIDISNYSKGVYILTYNNKTRKLIKK